MPDLVGHDRHPSAFLVYLFLYRHSRQGPREWSLREIGEKTGLAKRSVQTATARLEKRGLLRVTRTSITAVGGYEVLTPWL